MDMEGIYLKLIASAESRNGKPRYSFSQRTRNRKKGFEVHHIMPGSMGGSNRPYNLVYLTPREHYTAHHLLARMFSGPLTYAFWRMSQKEQGTREANIKITARQYQTARELFSITHSAFLKGKKQSPEAIEKRRITMSQRPPVQSFLGRTHSEETKQRMREAHLGKDRTEEHKRNISLAKKGVKKNLTDEQRAAIGDRFRGVSRPRLDCPHCGKSVPDNLAHRYHFENCPSLTGKKYQISEEMSKKRSEGLLNLPIKTCPHCGKQGRGGAMVRHHFDNCKHKPN
ncbi:NUMOD3 domain-containing DNA-binding protein [Kluyvera genomosp. 3]|uniref:Nuclease associated modular domain-containing protein n=1 Tax=Kluyvera genomosp. 3 TaxID=2774055 RepID=A0A6G9RII0_9ENTR|nr:NUMOD3 domain-containing DNA-binding protein [Kluyvera genomosp. 3]QIR26710.1 hypothetical protein GY169_07710 [Kluyvera genomosp. 3]